MPQAWFDPRLRLSNERPPTTATGVVLHPRKKSQRSVVALLPSWPDEFSPQQYACPAASTPQLKLPPAAIVWNVAVEATAVGASDQLTLPAPRPSWPNWLRPQQNAPPWRSIAHECASPAATARQDWVPPTGVGVAAHSTLHCSGRLSTGPAPIWPSVAEPQQYAAFPAMAQV